MSTFLRQLFSKCRVHGNGEAQVALSEWDIQVLLQVMCNDLGINLPKKLCDIDSTYYNIPIEYYANATNALPENDIFEVFSEIMAKNIDYQLYISNLSALHRRRVKYTRILSTQMKSEFDQISPRSLLEYGMAPSQLLCNWMLWRKWIYDIDNRSAQETGYLFEPIVAACMGGAPVGAAASPVKRVVNGLQTTDGRQIDCYIPSHKKAYELKLRVTIAASGQGRWGEELSFPAECKAAGIEPNLLVLDPTPNSRLSELIEAYHMANGSTFLGPDAWGKMEHEAGEVMGIFLEKYIRPPLQDMKSFEPTELDSVTLTWKNNAVEVTSMAEKYTISRNM